MSDILRGLFRRLQRRFCCIAPAQSRCRPCSASSTAASALA
jgi:hypothetical protein